MQQAHTTYLSNLRSHEKEKERAEASFKKQVEKWQREVERFIAKQKTHNEEIDVLAKKVSEGEREALIDYASLALEHSDYKELFEKSFEIDYDPADRRIGVACNLPSPDTMPVVKSVRFIQSTGELKETYISEREKKANYDSACYQICLRTLYELLKADKSGAFQKFLFNGFASYIDRNTGQETVSCIMSILVERETLQKIDFAKVDPKRCFKSLKGVSAAQLADLAAIPPVMSLNTEDKRFIEARSVAEGLNSGENIAAMHWSDFEHLVREVFEKEFMARGGEVKVTQSSHDGGVDAVAFDPDPITGGKIVIQAKRYTRTVGVNSVRDLFGTMQHEGASRGILITTADFGSDAYDFANGKPITLMTGGNLLHLLNKHGYQAKIDLKAAREALQLEQA